MYRTFNYVRGGHARSAFGFDKLERGHVEVLAYTDRKQTTTVVMPFEQVAELGINPWQLDLFDNDPVRVKVGRRELNFRRLKDITFAYTQKKQLFVGTHDGKTGMCFTGDTSRQRAPGQLVDARLELVAIEVSDRPFKSHFLEYLRCKEEMGDADWLTRLANSSVNMAFPLVSGNPIVMQGTTLQYGMRFSSTKHQQLDYCGEMFREMDVPVALPEPINRVFKLFPQGQPVVTGGAIARLLILPRLLNGFLELTLGTPLRLLPFEAIVARELCGLRVPVAIQDINAPSLRSQSRTKMTDGGITYDVLRIQPKHAIQTWLRTGANLSAMGIFCARENTITGSRIALFDIARRQFRSLTSKGPSEDIKARAIWRNNIGNT